MSLTDRFQLLDLKRDEGARTFEAREIATGRPVLVHIFADRTSPLNRALLAKLDALPEAERRRVIDRGEHEGGLYLVTDRLVDYPGLREWLTAKHPDPAKPLDARGAWQIKPPLKPSVDDQLAGLFDPPPPPAPTLAPIPVPLTNTGEQTLQMPVPEVSGIAAPKAPVIALDSPPAFKIPAVDEPGEFTRQFTPPVLRPAAPPLNAPVAREAAPKAPAPKIPAADDGEFTRQFAPPVLRPTAPNPPPTPVAQEAGEFTRQFAAPTPVNPQPRPAPARVETPPSAHQPGEFTQMLQAQVPRPAAPVTPSQLPSSSGEFTRFFQSPMTPAPPAPPNATPHFATPQFASLSPTPTPPQPRGAGEFTQIFGRGDMPSPPPPPSPAAPPPHASSGNATQVFATPPQSAAPMMMPAPNALGQAHAGPQVPAQGPGEYTRMFSAPAPLTFGQAPASPQTPRLPQPAPRARNKSRLPILLVLGAAGLLVVALIVYFAMRPH